jgi:phosphoserine phosphatase
MEKACLDQKSPNVELVDRVRKPGQKLRLIVFDMDGVLVDVKSSWQFVHAAFGVDNRENVKQYVEGRMTYEELMKRDIALWGRVHIDKIRSILSQIQLMPGAVEAFAVLKEACLKTALISAGVSVLAERLDAVLELDHIYANRLLTDRQGLLTGEGEGTVGLMNKLDVLKKLAAVENVSLQECAVVGDSLFDVPMFREAGLSIAFNADDRSVEDSADVVVKRKDLREILPYLTERV